MTHVVTNRCINVGAAACAEICPADCIHPRAATASSNTAGFWIDPEVCLDCGLCVDICPVGAIWHQNDLINAGANVALWVPAGPRWSCR